MPIHANSDEKEDHARAARSPADDFEGTALKGSTSTNLAPPRSTPPGYENDKLTLALKSFQLTSDDFDEKVAQPHFKEYSPAGDDARVTPPETVGGDLTLNFPQPLDEQASELNRQRGGHTANEETSFHRETSPSEVRTPHHPITSIDHKCCGRMSPRLPDRLTVPRNMTNILRL
jgi:hypothetical protein